MQVIETNRSGLSREYTVTVSAADIEAKIDHRLKELAGQVRIPGFRPGKAPLAMLRQRYGEAVRGEVLERAVQDSSAQAMVEQGVRPAAQPKIEIETVEPGADLTYKLAIEALPEIEPGDFSTIALEKLVAEPDETAVDEAVGRIAAENPDLEEVDPARPAQDGDTVQIDFIGRLDGEAFDGGAAQDFDLKLGSGRFIPGFEPQLVGVSAGEEKDVTVTFPEDYPAEALAGKEAVFAVTMKVVKEEKERVIDDEFAKALGMDSLDAVKDAVRQRMSEEFGQLTKARLKRALLDALADRYSFEVPPSLVAQEFESIWAQVQAEAERAGEDAPDEAEYRTIAERRVRLGLLLTEVGRRNDITVSQDDLNRALMNEARSYPGQEARMIEHYRRNPQLLESLRAPLFEDKVVDFITALADVKEKVVSVEELAADPDEAETPAAEEAAEAEAETAGAKPKAKKKEESAE